MASKMLGRCACPECGFHAAHVKLNVAEGKRPYRHCPECSAQYFTRTDFQAAALIEKIRQGEAPEIDTPPESEVVQASAIAPTPETEKPVVTPPKTKLVFGVRVPA